ncbi:ABC-type enterobactin transport system, permease component [Hahella chejuensis KCTC 2396]|uniref:ABC-type enterobactin transport system, permease component n=1 Tax=Hahella chejuensis (strain KCTC 2396) TaxID=349521 RepID=Q2SFP9_HAHCH|nr:iron-enterobactin ABC transporter permease [Hahella chejuensis]ABC30525.1 ABC-type enterobactin transport system, permease component [Hahella chejuensis KCTC 2396]
MNRADHFLIGGLDSAVSLPLDKRALRLGVILCAACLGLSLFALGWGTLTLTFNDVVQALFGNAQGQIQVVVTQWRLPRITAAVILGAALGVSGAIFQSLLRNPLGSPDVVGFNTGAYSGALLVIAVFQGGYYETAAGALSGGLATALVVYALAWRKGSAPGFRLIIVGIAVSALLNAFNTWLMISASLQTAMSAALWGAGSLNGVTWSKVSPSLIFCLLAIAAAVPMQRRIRLLAMGDDAAQALGVPVNRSRLALMLLAVSLTAAATAATGPISFIALAAPQITRRLLGANDVSLLNAAWMGALLLLAADQIAHHLFAPSQLPVGVVTISVGGVYLAWLLINDSPRKTS